MTQQEVRKLFIQEKVSEGDTETLEIFAGETNAQKLVRLKAFLSAKLPDLDVRITQLTNAKTRIEETKTEYETFINS